MEKNKNMLVLSLPLTLGYMIMPPGADESNNKYKYIYRYKNKTNNKLILNNGGEQGERRENINYNIVHSKRSKDIV